MCPFPIRIESLMDFSAHSFVSFCPDFSVVVSLPVGLREGRGKTVKTHARQT